MKKKISVIVPCYNEEKALPYFYDEITKVSESMIDQIGNRLRQLRREVVLRQYSGDLQRGQ